MKKYAFALLAILAISSCKKEEDTDPEILLPDTSTDFRENYVGLFHIEAAHTGWESMPPDFKYRRFDTSYSSFDVVITYSKYDSASTISSFKTTRPALTLTFEDGSKKLYGIDTTGRLYYDTDIASSNSGGFVSTDSIAHIYKQDYKYNGFLTIEKGKRIHR